MDTTRHVSNSAGRVYNSAGHIPNSIGRVSIVHERVVNILTMQGDALTDAAERAGEAERVDTATVCH